jgi:hypothetical protein
MRRLSCKGARSFLNELFVSDVVCTYLRVINRTTQSININLGFYIFHCKTHGEEDSKIRKELLLKFAHWRAPRSNHIPNSFRVHGVNDPAERRYM